MMKTTTKSSKKMKKTRRLKQAGFINRVAGAILITAGLSVRLSLRRPGSMKYRTNIFGVEIAGTFSPIVERLSNDVRLVVGLAAIT